MGLKRVKSRGTMHLSWEQEVIEKLWARFTPSGDILPYLPHLPHPDPVGILDGESERSNLPDLPHPGEEAREEREIPNRDLPAYEPYRKRDREMREERENTFGEHLTRVKEIVI